MERPDENMTLFICVRLGVKSNSTKFDGIDQSLHLTAGNIDNSHIDFFLSLLLFPKLIIIQHT